MKVTNLWIGPPEADNKNNNPLKRWYINQCGYDTDKTKRATFSNGARGSTFHLVSATDETIVYTGKIRNQIADFSKFRKAGKYYLVCNGVTSYQFTIGKNRLWDVSAFNSLKFMEMARQDTFETGFSTGYAWRDSHQFSFELNGLVMQYMSNPSYYNSMPWDVYRVEECEYEELRTQTEPNIIWLMKFAVMRYYKWNTEDAVELHALIKGQVAYFLYLYPHITDYVDSTWYGTIRDWLIEQWSAETCNKAWFDVSINHNLYTTQSAIGTAKGACPPGYAIVPNLMMYDVAVRDGLETAADFKAAATNNIAWLVNSVDLTNPRYTKGQRMSEYIPFHAMTYAYEVHPELCPDGTYDKILKASETLISLSMNLWDYTMYSSSIWVNSETQGTGLCNNPGYCGMMAVYYSLARVITDKTISQKLRQLAVAHLDHAYGRNPLGRHYCYTATEEFDGAKLGWVYRLGDGAGALEGVIGVLDGSPKEENYPYDPDGDTGYTEGWVAFNSAWNMALAYLSGENSEITDGIGIFAK